MLFAIVPKKQDECHLWESVLHYCYYFCLITLCCLQRKILFLKQQSSCEPRIRAVDLCLFVYMRVVMMRFVFQYWEGCVSFLKNRTFSQRVSESLAFHKKVICVPSLHAWSLISGDVRSKLLLAPAPPFMHLSWIAAWKNKERRDGDVQEILAGLPLKTSTIAKQRHLPATTNTLEINYLWNAVKNSLIFSFYPIKMPNRFKPFTMLVSNTLGLFLLPSFRPYFFFPNFFLRLHIRKNGSFIGTVKTEEKVYKVLMNSSTPTPSGLQRNYLKF